VSVDSGRRSILRERPDIFIMNSNAILESIKVKPFSCPACRERFDNLESLEHHIATAGHLNQKMHLTLDELKALECPEVSALIIT